LKFPLPLVGLIFQARFATTQSRVKREEPCKVTSYFIQVLPTLVHNGLMIREV